MEKLTIWQQLSQVLNPSLDLKAKVIDAEINNIQQDKSIIDNSNVNLSQQELELKFLSQKQSQLIANQHIKATSSILNNPYYQNTTSNRINAYADYDGMCFYPIIGAAIDLISEECVTVGNNGKILTVFSNKDRIKNELEHLFYNILDINSNIFYWTRTTVKYGDCFLYLITMENEGVKGIVQLPMSEMERTERVDNKKIVTEFKRLNINETYTSLQIAHFRLLSDDKYLPYGTSIIDKARRTVKQLIMVEDAMLMYRIERAPERRIFKIDVGNIAQTDVTSHMQKISNHFKKQTQVSKSGQISHRYDPPHSTEDYFIPVRNGQNGTIIDTLPGACLALDTEIELLDGRSLKLSDIISEVGDGKKLSTYSINPETGEIVPGIITHASVTRKNTEVVRITLDNGKTITCTPDHKFDTRFNGIKQAKDLIEGESLWSFNKEFKPIKSVTNDYEMIYDHSLNKLVYTHKMVSNYFINKGHNIEYCYDNKYGTSGKTVIHHVNCNRYDNTIENLVLMNPIDHFILHGKVFPKVGGDALKNKMETDENFKEKIFEQLKNARDNYYKNVSQEDLLIKNNKISISNKKYNDNLSPEDKEIRAERSRNNIKNGYDSFRERYNSDIEFKANLHKKCSDALKITKNLPKYKEIASKNLIKLWESEEYRTYHQETNTLKYPIELFNILREYIEKTDGKQESVLLLMNDNNSEFRQIFYKLNKNHKKIKNCEKIENLYKFGRFTLNSILTKYNYNNGWRDFISNIKYFNHKIVSVEFLEEKMDTGTITIDAKHEFHDFHNFALTVGVFTRNSNLDQIEDLKYLRANLVTSLGIPGTFLGFEEATGDGKNLAMADVRFAKKVNRIQQAMIQELNKIALIHLYLKGYRGDDLEGYTLALTNPSIQGEILKIETMKAKMDLYIQATAIEDNKIAPMSHTRGKKEIFGWTDHEIVKDAQEQAFERLIGLEITSMPTLIKNSGLFNDLIKRYKPLQFEKDLMPKEPVEGEGGELPTDTGSSTTTSSGVSDFDGGADDLADASATGEEGIDTSATDEFPIATDASDTTEPTSTEPEKPLAENSLLVENKRLNNRISKNIKKLDKKINE